MQRLVLASHGYLAEGMKNSAQIIVGKSAKIYTICAYVKEGITLESQINELFDSFPEDDEMIVVTDIFGGSVNNEFMQRLQNRRFWLVSGMNLPLVIQLAMAEDGGRCSCAIRCAARSFSGACFIFSRICSYCLSSFSRYAKNVFISSLQISFP